MARSVLGLACMYPGLPLLLSIRMAFHGSVMREVVLAIAATAAKRRAQADRAEPRRLTVFTAGLTCFIEQTLRHDQSA